MQEKKKLLGYYNYTVILTYIGMLFGFFGVLLCMEEAYLEAAFCLLSAGFCDMFDGAIASTMDRTPSEKCFGIQIDSLSDLICFGVLPSVLVYGLNRPNHLALVVSGLYVLCALVRLAFFNVDEQERQQLESTSREYYLGMPVTTSALFIPTIYALGVLLTYSVSTILAIVLVVMGICFLVPFTMRKPHMVGKVIMTFFGFGEAFLLGLAWRMLQ